MNNLLGALQVAGATAAKDKDPFFENTTLLLHGDGNQGATNFNNAGSPSYLAFKDNSTNNFPITVNGDAYGDNFSPFSRDEGAWSNYFDGTGDDLAVASNAALQLASESNWTVEFWGYFVSTPDDFDVIVGKGTGSGTYEYFFEAFSDRTIDILYSGDGTTTWTGQHQLTPAINLGVWFHFAAVRNGATFKSYVNGTEYFSGSSFNIYAGSGVLNIGGYSGAAGQDPNMYLSNLRIVKGSAVYTGNFTPSTSPLTAITNTSLLTCQSNRFKDNSSNNFAITRNGDVTVSPFTPFTVTPNTTDGSGFFDGTGDSISAPSNSAFDFGTGSFTLECWFNKQGAGGSSDGVGNVLVYTGNGSSNAAWLGITDSGTIIGKIGFNGSSWVSEISGGSVGNGSWNHVALVRNGTAVNLYLNGASIASTTNSTNLSTYGTSASIGVNLGSTRTFNGFISNARIVKSAAYTSTFTPPTTALTAIDNTSLLACQYQGTVRNVGFIDSSPYDHLITRVGNTTQGTFSPFSKPDGRWGTYYDGTGDYLNVGTITALGSGDFTISAWVYPQKISAGVFHVGGLPSTVSGVAVFLSGTAAEGWGLYAKNTQAVSNTGAITLNKWYYITVIRSGTTTTLYVDGVSAVVISSDSTNYSQTSLVIGGFYSTSYLMLGYISNFRIVSSALTATVPTAPFTAVSGTTLLTCQSNRFIDNSSNNFTITANGDVKVTPFSPFPNTTAYNPAVNGGSAYFDGVNDTLDLASNPVLSPGSGDFTVEAWFYPTAALDTYEPLYTGSGTGTILFGKVTNGYGLRVGGVADVISTPAPAINQWVHIAVSRQGTSLRVFTNGTLGNTVTNSTTFGTSVVSVGTTTNDLTGYVAGLRFVKGTAVYTDSFSIPTAPPTAIANTSLLLNFTHAGILDHTMSNNLETVGNAQIDTSVKKFGTGAMKFDGTGDYLTVQSPIPPTTFGSADFTIEFWFNASATSTTMWLLDGRIATPADGAYPAIYINSSNNLIYYVNAAARITGSTALSTGTWYHIAVVRSSGVTKMYLNGAQEGSNYTDTTVYANPGASRPAIGIATNIVQGFNGYIDDLRITNGIARYTANFTPQVKIFPDIG